MILVISSPALHPSKFNMRLKNASQDLKTTKKKEQLVSKGGRHSFIVGPHRRNPIQKRIAESPLNKDFLRASHIWHPEKVGKQ